jgi:hypothetical protein
VGPRVAEGSKRGFSIPVESWMANRWHDRVAESLSDPLIVSEGWIAREPLRRELADAASRGQASRRLWYLWVLEDWMRVERASRPTGALAANAGAVTATRSGEASWQ